MNTVYGKSVAVIEQTDGERFGENGGFTAVLSTPSLDRDGDRLHRDEWIEPLEDRYPLDIDHGMSVADTVGSFHPYFDGDQLMMDAYFASTPKAQEVRTLVTEGHVRNVSVAFMTDRSKKDSEPKRELLNAGIVATPSNRDAVILASKAASALKDALSDATEGDVPEEVKAAVLEALGGTKPEITIHGNVHNHTEGKATEAENASIYVDIIPRFDYDGFAANLKAAMTASGIGGDGALVQAIHDASSHLGAACPVIEVTDEDDGASSGANKSADPITFINKAGQTIHFDSHDDAREFFTDMLKSIEDAEADGVTLCTAGHDTEAAVATLNEQGAFEKALDQILKPESSGSPEAPAPVDETPAPASPDADDAELKARAMQMSLALLNPIHE